MTDTIYIDTLKRHFGYDSFRGIQLDIIKSIVSGHDTLGLMPTGGGKSIAFQVPALTMEGVCIVVTPLIALMKDQVEHLKAKDIKAEAIHSEMSKQEIQTVLDNTIYGAVKFLYVSPERLSQPLFCAKLYYMKVCFITVDEAHCISQWGHDFRPSYLNIGTLREKLPDAPILALTATATPNVIEEIQQKLFFGKYSSATINVFRMSFKRQNLSYVVRRTENKIAELIHILQSVQGCAIVYTRSRQKTKEIANFLCETGLQATYYHAGLDFAIKHTHQRLWQNDETRIIVATNAFGMGIDKPDVRLVIHIDCPDSLEEYFQEAGRAGRDGKRSYAVLLHNKSDTSGLIKRVREAFPPKDYIKKVYEHLAYFFEIALETGAGACFEFDEFKFCHNFGHYPSRMYEALKILERAGYIHYNNDPDTQSRVQIVCNREYLYKIEGLSKNESIVLTALLRLYGTLFVDLTYINEHKIENITGITNVNLRIALQQLAQRGIIKYIPRRNVPLLTFTTQRIATKYLTIKKEIYEEQREKLAERVSAVIRYIENDDICRQRILLSYFGEENSVNCNHCDVCLKDIKDEAAIKNTLQIIKNLLGDGNQHPLAELNRLPVSRKSLGEALEELLRKEQIVIDGPFITIVK